MNRFASQLYRPNCVFGRAFATARPSLVARRAAQPRSTLSKGAQQASELYQEVKNDVEQHADAIAETVGEYTGPTAARARAGARNAKRTAGDAAQNAAEKVRVSASSSKRNLENATSRAGNAISDEMGRIRERGLDEVKDLGRTLIDKVSTATADLKENVKRTVSGSS